MPFKSELHLRTHASQEKWELTAPLFYLTKADQMIVVPVGYRTDLASVPRLAWVIVPRDDPMARRPSVVHDYIYTDLTKRFTKAEADQIFYQALLEQGMHKPLAWLMWCAVRIGGRGNWSK